MSQTAVSYMLTQMGTYFDKVKAAIATGGGGGGKTVYQTGIVSASGTTTLDLPTILGFNTTDYQIYSLGLQLRMIDPMITTNPPVVDALTVLRYEIQADGKVLIRNNHTADVTFYLRATAPVKK